MLTPALPFAVTLKLTKGHSPVEMKADAAEVHEVKSQVLSPGVSKPRPQEPGGLGVAVARPRPPPCKCRAHTQTWDGL